MYLSAIAIYLSLVSLSLPSLSLSLSLFPLPLSLCFSSTFLAVSRRGILEAFHRSMGILNNCLSMATAETSAQDNQLFVNNA